MVVSRLASIAGRKLAKKLATKLNRSAWRKKHYKSLKPYAIKAKSEKTYKAFRQKPKHPGGGAAVATTKGFIGDYKVSRSAKRAIWHDTRARGSESWRSEMTRVFGGAHMAQAGPGLKRSMKLLHRSYAKDIRKLRKKLKTKLSVGGLVIGKNVDLSLL